MTLDFGGSAICWSMDSTKLVVGIGIQGTVSTKDGAFMILNSETLDIIFEDRKSKLYISEVKFSPNDKYLGIIYIYIYMLQNIYIYVTKTKY